MTNAYVMETMLLRWSDSHTGRTVTLLLPDEGDHPFKGLKCGPANGQRLAVSIALIADDETVHQVPEHKTQPRSLTEGGAKATSRVTMAGILCREKSFWTFLNERYGPFSGGAVKSEQHAAVVVRGMCMVESRQLLDVDHEGGQAWDQMLSNYRAWQRELQCGVGS